MDAAKEAIDCVEASKETGAYTMDDRQLGLSVSKSTSTTDPFELGRANYTYIFTGDGMLILYIGPKGYEWVPQEDIKARCEELGFKYPN